MLKLKKTFISPEEYFEIEEAAEYKSEYYHGEMFAMSGASYHHNVIAMMLPERCIPLSEIPTASFSEAT